MFGILDQKVVVFRVCADLVSYIRIQHKQPKSNLITLS